MYAFDSIDSIPHLDRQAKSSIIASGGIFFIYFAAASPARGSPRPIMSGKIAVVITKIERRMKHSKNTTFSIMECIETLSNVT